MTTYAYPKLTDAVCKTSCTDIFLNCDEDKAARHGHLTAGQAGAIANKANAGKLLLTHFSQRYGKDIDFTKDAKAIHHDVLQMNDGDIYDL